MLRKSVALMLCVVALAGGCRKKTPEDGTTGESVPAVAAPAGFVHVDADEPKVSITSRPITVGQFVEFLRETPRGESSSEVTIEPFPHTRDHPLMRDVFPLNTWEGKAMEWKLHERSHLVNDAKSSVVPLVSCPQTQEFGSTTVAFTFAFTSEGGGRPVTGRKKRKRPVGRVLFVSSHFKDEAGGDKDGYALQQLLLNFILEKQEQRRSRR